MEPYLVQPALYKGYAAVRICIFACFNLNILQMFQAL